MAETSKPKVEYVEITLRLDHQMINLLKANIALNSTDGDLYVTKTDPAHVLGLVAMMEARGATPEQIHVKTPIQWRGNVEPVPNTRRTLDKDLNVISDEKANVKG